MNPKNNATRTPAVAQYPDLNNYSLIFSVEDIVVLYRPEEDRAVLVSFRGQEPQKLKVTTFAVTTCSLAIEKLEGLISGLLQVDFMQHQQPTHSRVIRLNDIAVKLYPIRAKTFQNSLLHSL